jgi:hypothetical protein
MHRFEHRFGKGNNIGVILWGLIAWIAFVFICNVGGCLIVNYIARKRKDDSNMRKD